MALAQAKPLQAFALGARTASLYKDQLEPLLGKVQDLREDLRDRYKDIFEVAKAKGRVLDKRIKTQPYAYALGAIV